MEVETLLDDVSHHYIEPSGTLMYARPATVLELACYEITHREKMGKLKVMALGEQFRTDPTNKKAPRSAIYRRVGDNRMTRLELCLYDFMKFGGYAVLLVFEPRD